MYCQVSGSEMEDWAEETLAGTKESVTKLLEDPMSLVEGLAQGISDTYEEKGIWYCGGYVAGTAAGAKVAADGMKGMKGEVKKGKGVWKDAGKGGNGSKLSEQIEGNSYDINKLQKTQSYTYPENVSSLKDSIGKNGPNSVPPIEVRVHNGQALVVDGHHRLEAFRQLRYDRVPIKYLHSSQLGKNLPDGTYYRSIDELLDSVIKN